MRVNLRVAAMTGLSFYSIRLFAQTRPKPAAGRWYTKTHLPQKGGSAWFSLGKSLIKTTKACLFQCKPACMPYQIKYSARPSGGPSAMRCRPNRAVKLHTPLYTDYSLYAFQTVVKKLLHKHIGSFSCSCVLYQTSGCVTLY